MNRIRAEDILHKLRKVRKSGKGWVSCCPAHDDRRPSLSIADGDRGLLLHCFTGCSIEQVKQALGLDNYRPIAPIIRRAPAIEPSIDFEGMFRKWERDTEHYFLDGFAMTLGVDTDALEAIGCAWTGKAWAFPMRGGRGQIIGIRLRDCAGGKWAVKGSKQGLFIPSKYPYCVNDALLFIVEGPTDLAAAMTMGLWAIGRPSCQGQESLTSDFIRSKKTHGVVVVSDNDQPGLVGARKLQDSLPRRSCIWTPPTKDMREYALNGGSAMMIESSIRDIVWRQPA